jgi:hypothetical protein
MPSDIFDVDQAPFKSELRGSFGIVKTNTSFELDFVLSSIEISRITDLETASSALDVQFARFSDLLQRDIDYERVEKIMNQYLERGANRTVFFPPLLVSLVAFEDTERSDKATKITEYFQTVGDTVEDAWLVRTWDNNRFQLRLHSASGDGAVPFIHQGKPEAVLPFGCYLKWNPRFVKLVIIDGQHRLCALQTLYGDLARRHILADMHIPICVVFPPNATSGNARGESIRATLRDLFVTINQTAKEVSGHFLVLLDDKRLSAMAVRDLAELWKATPLGVGLTKLHLLEWNQRSEARVNQRDKAYSVSTVSIVADVLDKSVFDVKTGGLTSSFLNLSECRNALEEDSTWPRIESISNREFHPAQIALLEKQIKRYLTPALNVLLSEPSPYRRKAKRVADAKAWLDAEVVRMAKGAQDYRDQCLLHFRKWTTLDHDTARPIESDFESRCEHDDDDGPFFLNVFQQGLMRAWIEFAREMLRYSVSPTESASFLVKGLERICFAHAKSYFAGDKAYARLSLYKDGGAVIVTEVAREQWKRLILITLLNQDVWNDVESGLSGQLDEQQRAACRTELKAILDQCLFDFIEDLTDATQRDFERNWKDRDVTAQQQENIRGIITQDGDKSDKFKEYISKNLTAPRVKKAKNRLRAVLELE